MVLWTSTLNIGRCTPGCQDWYQSGEDTLLGALVGVANGVMLDADVGLFVGVTLGTIDGILVRVKIGE